ncbi:MAG: T9SS type A sorting domain-containing protein [Fibrobacteres bacterium]|nr:T9SS type A sorting domain-containing protein [Fibrobacterota bacterium]
MVKLLVLAFYVCIEALNIPIEVHNWADIERQGEPVTGGIPLFAGQVKDLATLRITDGSGKTIPAQFRALSRYWIEKNSDGSSNPSVKWLLCDFQPDIASKGSTSFYVNDDGANISPAKPLSVLNGSDKITVNTGVLKFTISKTRFNLFDEVWLDVNQNGHYEITEQIIKTGNSSGGFITAGDWNAGGCISGKIHSASQRGPDRVFVEENGPLKILIRIEGRHFDDSATVSRGLYGYQCFITAYAGKPYVDVQWALTNTYLDGNKPKESGTATPWTMYSWPFKKYTLSLDLDLSTAAAQSGVLLPDSEVKFTAGATPAELDQRYLKYTCTGGATGVGAKGAVSLSDGQLGVRVAMRIFGANAPKNISVTTNKINLNLFPDTGNTEPYWLETKTRKNHRMRFEFFNGTATDGALTKLWHATDAPMRILASDPALYRNTGAWERGFGIPEGSSYRRSTPSSWNRLDRMAQLSPGSEWAWQLTRLQWTSGGIHTIGGFNNGGDHDNLTSMFWKYILSGNPRDFELNEVSVLYFNDRVQEQYPADVWQKLDYFLNPVAHLGEYTSSTHGIGGLGQANFIEVSAFPGYSIRGGSDLPDAGHMTQLQQIEYYQLTGDPATLDAMKGLAVEAAAFAFEWNYIWRDRSRRDSVKFDSIFTIYSGNPRYMARPVMVCMHAYDMTGDERYLYPAKLNIYNLRNVVKRHPIGYMAQAGYTGYCSASDNPWSIDHPGVALPTYFSDADFQIGIGMEAFYSFLTRTGDEEIRDALIFCGKSAAWRMGIDTLGRYMGFPYSGWSDYGWSGKRYTSGGFTGSSAESFGGVIFSYLASGDTAFWKVCRDGRLSWGSTALPDLKALNYYQASWKHDSTDAIPPSAIKDLSVSIEQGNGLRFMWTSPGGNGSTGRAARYQLKAALSPIVDIPERWNSQSKQGWPDLNEPLPYTNADLVSKALNFTATQSTSFWAGTNLIGEPLPQVAGSTESFIVTGLDTSKLYYFAVVSYDSAGNVSSISNVVTSKGTLVEKNKYENRNLSICGISPNPFNPSTVISFYLPKMLNADNVELTIVDLAGRTICSWQKNGLEAGYHKQQWDGVALDGKFCGSGVYLVQLKVGKKIVRSSMALVR